MKYEGNLFGLAIYTDTGRYLADKDSIITPQTKEGKPDMRYAINIALYGYEN